MLTTLSSIFLTSQINANPWDSCVKSQNYTPSTSTSGIQILDRFNRDITTVDMSLLDWEGFIQNPQSRFKIIPPAGAKYPITMQVSADEAPRLYIFQRHEGEHPYDVRNYLSVHNEQGPMWGGTLVTLADEEIFGGVPHELTDQQLVDIGLIREIRTFSQQEFPLELHLGIHPDRNGDNENYTLNIIMTDAEGTEYKQDIPVSVCDQDKPEREVEFKFHVDYSTDWGGYLENTQDGMVVKQGFERILNDVAYFFEDMRFDTMGAGQCSAFVNWTVEDQPGYATNSFSFNDGYYLFINSHSGGGGLSSQTRHTRNGEDTGFPACGFWGANPRDELTFNVNTRIYLPEDDWWRTNNHMIYGRNGECLGDTLDDPGNGCIQCPEGEDWCGHQRGDIYWPNLHELNHGLTMSGDWTRWKKWFDSDTLCIDDPDLIVHTGTCLPMYKTDHVVLGGHTSASNQQGDRGRTLFTRFDIMLMQAVGWELRETSMLEGLTINNDELPEASVGNTYEGAIEVKGGIPSYNFKIISGNLPPGLTLNSFNGNIAGQPTIAGNYEFTIQLMDSDQYNVLRVSNVTKKFTVVVND